MSVTSQEDDGVMGGDERKRKIRSKSLSGPKLEGGNLEKGQSLPVGISEIRVSPLFQSRDPGTQRDELITTQHHITIHQPMKC